MDEEQTTANGGPQYLHIAGVLRAEIADGVFRIGQRLPSQAELEERFKVSRPTVQRALHELRKGGYIDNQRGRSAQVLDRERGHDGGRAAAGRPERTYLTLPAHLSAAFEQPRVTLDAFSLTTETLGSALAGPLDRVKSGELNPESITVRLLLPSLDLPHGIPRSVADREDPRPVERLRELVHGHAVALRSAFTALSHVRPGVRQSVEFRTVPTAPVHKIYLLNGQTALVGYYRVEPRGVDLGGAEPEQIYDVRGVDAMLFPHQADPDDPDDPESAFVEETRKWFESVWSTVARPMSPAG